eukprot:TRINITY_DN4923_c0_g1_i2.p1 TRINITY_DN4923_c0_g1~~TRINITY_DN4923_c0_g1_i2.p1  ORF type:complete len:618 (-),score=90.66 TRINITY_DN4923_c0_g1_i2:100-1953(-)
MQGMGRENEDDPAEKRVRWDVHEDDGSLTCEPEVPEDWSPGKPRKGEGMGQPPSAEGAKLLPAFAPQLSSDSSGTYESTSSTALLTELQVQRRLLQESLAEAFDAMERKMKRVLQHQQHWGELEADDSLLPAPDDANAQRAISRLSCMTTITDLDEGEQDSESTHDEATEKALHRQMCAADNRTACAVTGESHDWDRFATKITSCQTAEGGPPGCCNGFFTRLRAITENTYFELTFAALILLNTCTMAIEFQYHSLDVCFNIDYPNCERPKEELWPGADMAFWILEMAFGLLFTSEVSLKLLGQGVYFICSGWNCLDFIIILSWMLTTLSETDIGMNPMLMRLARIARLLRFLRLVKTVQMFNVLQLLIGSLRASGLILFWSAVVLTVVMVCASLVSHSVMLNYIQDESLDMETRHEAYMVFGSFARSFMTMYQMTFGLDNNASGMCFELSEWFGIPLIMYQGLVSFAVIKVIEAVFLNETIKLAASNDELMIMEKNRWESMQEDKVHSLFKEADESGDGLIDCAEFMLIMQDERITAWLEAMEVEVTNPKMVWDLLCSFSARHGGAADRLSAEWFVKGIARLKGGAKSLDLLAMHRELDALSTRIQTLDQKPRPSK